MPTPKIIQFLPISLPSEKIHFLSNSIICPEYLHQYQDVLLIQLHQTNNFPVLDNCHLIIPIYLINNVNIHYFPTIKWNFILF